MAILFTERICSSHIQNLTCTIWWVLYEDKPSEAPSSPSYNPNYCCCFLGILGFQKSTIPLKWRRFRLHSCKLTSHISSTTHFCVLEWCRCQYFGNEAFVILINVRDMTAETDLNHDIWCPVSGLKPAVKAISQEEHTAQAQSVLTPLPRPLRHPPQTPPETSKLGTRTPPIPLSIKHRPLPPPSPLPRPIPTPQHRPLTPQQ